MRPSGNRLYLLTMPDTKGHHRSTIYATLQFIRYHGGWVYKAYGGLGSRPGVPDIIACLPHPVSRLGIFIGVEVKTGRGELSLNQKKEKEWIERAGGIFIVAADVTEVEAALLDAGIITVKTLI